MPMSGDTYVAPTWSDNAPPAIDAAELNAISQTLVALQNGEISLRDAVNSLTEKVNGKSKVVTGSYVGTGNNTVTISLPGTPSIVVISSAHINGSGCTSLWMKYPINYSLSGVPRANGVSYTSVSWMSNSVTLSAKKYGDVEPYNWSGETYFYLAVL